jgi:hypothetical protein
LFFRRKTNGFEVPRPSKIDEKSMKIGCKIDAGKSETKRTKNDGKWRPNGAKLVPKDRLRRPRGAKGRPKGAKRRTK